MAPEFTISVLGAQKWDKLNNNVDVVITLSDGRQFAATFFTLRNIEELFEKNRTTVECAQGLYLWASDMILVRKLDRQTVEKTVDDLISTGEIESACRQVSGTSDIT